MHLISKQMHHFARYPEAVEPFQLNSQKLFTEMSFLSLEMLREQERQAGVWILTFYRESLRQRGEMTYQGHIAPQVSESGP